jgi:hypothetical protein
MDTGMEKEGRITLPGSVRAIQLSPDGKSLFVGGGPKILKIVDAQTKADVAYLWNGAEAAAKIERVDNVRMIAPQPKVAMDQLPVAVPERPASRGWLIAGLIVVAFIGVLFMAVIAVALFMMRRST